MLLAPYDVCLAGLSLGCAGARTASPPPGVKVYSPRAFAMISCASEFGTSAYESNCML